jgi:hypothetical protein
MVCPQADAHRRVHDLACIMERKLKASNKLQCIPMAEVETHKTADDGWIVVKGKVSTKLLPVVCCTGVQGATLQYPLLPRRSMTSPNTCKRTRGGPAAVPYPRSWRFYDVWEPTAQRRWGRCTAWEPCCNCSRI